MSDFALMAVRSTSQARGTERLVLMVLASYVTGAYKDVCWPSVETIAAGSALSVRHTRERLARLQADGEVTVLAGNGRGNTNRYRIEAVKRYAAQLAEARNQSAPEAETLLDSVPFSGETLLDSVPFSESGTLLNPAAFPAETLRNSAGFQAETLLNPAAEVIGTLLPTPSRQGTARASFYAPGNSAAPTNKQPIPARLRELTGFLDAWADWTDHKGPEYLEKPLTVRRALEFLASQPDPLEVIDYAIRNGRHTLTAKPPARADQIRLTLPAPEAARLEDGEIDMDALLRAAPLNGTGGRK